MTELIVLCGPKGSGKSTWAKNFVLKNPSYYIISEDQVKKTMEKTPEKVDTFIHMKLYYLLSHGKSVIFDGENLRAKDRYKLIQLFKRIEDIKFTCVGFTASLKTCEYRLNNSFPELYSQFKKFQRPSPVEGWNSISSYKGEYNNDTY